MAPDPLISQRGRIKAQLTRHKHFFERILGHEKADKIDELIVRLEKIELIWDEFNEVQDKIENLETSDPETQMSERDEFEANYFNLVAQIRKSINIETPHHKETSRSDENESEIIKLPPLELPTFDGSYDEWMSFFDYFKAIVHENSSLSGVQKMRYLKSCLKGSAASVISSIEISANNYKIAWDLLLERYHNKNYIVKRHIKDLFAISNIEDRSVGELQRLLDDTLKNVRALKSLGQPVDHWDALLVHLTTSKFDSETNRAWESKWAGQLASFDDLAEFMEHRLIVMKACGDVIEPREPKQKFLLNHRAKISSSEKKLGNSCLIAHPKPKLMKCLLCKEEHYLFNCQTFLESDTETRRKFVNSVNICPNCLRPGHPLQRCFLGGCRICGEKHNTLIHHTPIEEHPKDETQSASTSKMQHSVALFSTPSQNQQCLLSTALIKIHNNLGEPIVCRALLDSGSQVSILKKSIAKRLQLPLTFSNEKILGIGMTSASVSSFVEVKFSSADHTYTGKINFTIMDNITGNIPSLPVDMTKLNIPDGITLADPCFFRPGGVDALLGGNIFWDLMRTGHIRIAGGALHIQKTVLGWIVGGNVLRTSGPSSDRKIHCHLGTSHSLSDQLQKFWEIEEIASQRQFTGDDRICEEHFIETTIRKPDGRYVVEFPFKAHPEKLGQSKLIASKRFLSLERKLCCDKELHSGYSKFLDEYLQLGHMEEITEDQISECHYFLPHHPVLKESSSTTKLRVVFDASCRSSSGSSLNDLLMVGPVVQQDLFSILIRFRTHKYVITADIEKMYRQIEISPKHTNLQLILWRKSPNEKLKAYRLLTVTYGTASASYLATRVLIQLAKDEEKSSPQATRAALQDFYVDDFCSGGSNIEAVKETQSQLINMMHSGGFHLRKWSSNEPALLEDIPLEDRSPESHSFSPDTQIKLLGLIWNPKTDAFHWDVNLKAECETKRCMLSAISQIFDPLGLLGPVIIIAKILLQRLWTQSLDWDDTVPFALLSDWKQFSRSLAAINNLQIPRLMIPLSQAYIELHGFSDASERAYGACIYIKVTDANGKSFVNLVTAKSRVAPLKTTSLPRLELCAALLLAELTQTTSIALQIDLTSLSFHTDSMIVLGWIQSPSSHFTTFVSNRVAKIQELTPISQWFHVKGKENPADLISRGLTGTDFIASTLWWHGPDWLQNGHPNPAHSGPTISVDDLPERKASVTFLVITPIPTEIINRYSSLQKLINIVAYCFRFINNCKASRFGKCSSPYLTVQERQFALNSLIRSVQQIEFQKEYIQLEKGNVISSSSRISSLNCFLDKDKLIRVGGRLRNAPHLQTNAKHPIILPRSSHLTKLIIIYEHKTNLHAGPQLLLNIIRQNYWPVNGLTQVKKVLSSCITCFRLKAQLGRQIMGDLPIDRFQKTRPFFVTGIDYCGPFYTRMSRKRGVLTSKSYICVFVCYSTKAVHLELVEDLSTEAFLASLRRFVARRGKPKTIYSDNASNFQRASSDLKELHNLLSSSANKTMIPKTLAEEGIDWQFIPPYLPHFGGLWESAVKSAKFHIRRVVGVSKLTYSELNTVITQVEACLNSRPLTPLSTDPTDLQPLTPGHFLIGDALVATPDQDIQDVRINRLSRWQLVQQLTQIFWTRWSQDYLSNLQQRSKWKTAKTNLKLGSLALISDTDSSPLNWKLGRVVELHAGKDGIVRVVSLQTPRGIVKRGIHTISLLPEDPAYMESGETPEDH